jgi:hypothetical protein
VEMGGFDRVINHGNCEAKAPPYRRGFRFSKVKLISVASSFGWPHYLRH